MVGSCKRRLGVLYKKFTSLRCELGDVDDKYVLPVNENYLGHVLFAAILCFKQTSFRWTGTESYFFFQQV